MAHIFGLLGQSMASFITNDYDVEALRLVCKEMRIVMLQLLPQLRLTLAAPGMADILPAWTSMAVAMGHGNWKLCLRIMPEATLEHAQQLLDALAAAGSTTLRAELIEIVFVGTVGLLDPPNPPIILHDTMHSAVRVLQGITWSNARAIAVQMVDASVVADSVWLHLAPVLDTMQSITSVSVTGTPWSLSLATTFGHLHSVTSLAVASTGDSTVTATSLGCTAQAWPRLQSLSMRLPWNAPSTDQGHDVLPVIPLPQLTRLVLKRSSGALPLGIIESMFPALQDLRGPVVLNTADAATDAVMQHLSRLAAGSPELQLQLRCTMQPGPGPVQPTALLPGMLPTLRVCELSAPIDVLGAHQVGLEQIVERICLAAPQLRELHLHIMGLCNNTASLAEVFIHAVRHAPATLETISVWASLGGWRAGEAHSRLLNSMARVAEHVPYCRFTMPNRLSVHGLSVCNMVLGKARQSVAVHVHVQ